MKKYICMGLVVSLALASTATAFAATTVADTSSTAITTTSSAITTTTSSAITTTTSSAITTTTSSAITTTTGSAVTVEGTETTSGSAVTVAEKTEARKLSLQEALTIMKTTGIQAESADLSKQSDEAVGKGYSETVKKINKTLDKIDTLESYPSSVLIANDIDVVELAYEAQVAGATSNNKKVMQLRRDFAKNNTESNYQADLNQIEADTINIYYTVLLAQENLTISKDNLTAQQKTLKNIEAKKNVGVLSKKDVLEAQSAVAAAESDVRSADTNLKYAKMSFNYLLGYDVTQEVIFTDTLAEPTDNSVDVEMAVKNSLANRNEIRGADFAMDIYEVLLQDVFNYPKSSSTYLTAQINLLESEKTARNARSKIELDTRNKYDVLQDKKAAVAAAKDLQAYAKEGLRLVSLTTEEGMTTTEELLSTQVSEYKANLNLANANMEYILQLKSYEFAQGIGTTRIPL